MNCTVRTRVAEDLPALAEVLVRVHERDGYPVEGVADPLAWLSHPDALASWTAVIEEVPVGQVTLTSADPDEGGARIWTEHTGRQVSELAIVVRLFVDPGHRTVGAGRLLMASALRHATNIGRSVVLDVMAKDRDAIRLYERLGGRRIGAIEHKFGSSQTEPALVFDFGDAHRA